jgi:hypothetical protein
MSRRITLSPDTRAFVRDILTVMNRAGCSTQLGCSTEETVDGMIGLIEQGYLALHTRARRPAARRGDQPSHPRPALGRPRQPYGRHPQTRFGIRPPTAVCEHP